MLRIIGVQATIQFLFESIESHDKISSSCQLVVVVFQFHFEFIEKVSGRQQWLRR